MNVNSLMMKCWMESFHQSMPWEESCMVNDIITLHSHFIWNFGIFINITELLCFLFYFRILRFSSVERTDRDCFDYVSMEELEIWMFYT